MMFHQPCSVNCVGSSSEVRKRPSVGTSQNSADDDQDDVDRRSREEAHDPLRGASRPRAGAPLPRSPRARPPSGSAGCSGAGSGSRARTGRRRSPSRTPKSLMPPNEVRHMSRAITLASSWTDPGASAITMSKTLRTLISIVMKTTRQHRREQRHRDAPEDLPLGRAVRAGRLERVARDRGEPGRDHDHREAGPDPDVGEHDRGRDQLLAQPRRRPGTARRTCRRRSRAGTGRSSSSANSKVPFASVVMLSTLPPFASSSSTVTPGMPSSSGSTSPGVPPPGLEVSPDDPGDAALQCLGSHGLDRVCGHLGRADPGQAHERDAVRGSRRLSARARRSRWRRVPPSTASRQGGRPAG